MYVILYTLALAVFQGIEYLTCDVFMGGHPMTILNLDIFVLMFQVVITEVRRTSLIHPPLSTSSESLEMLHFVMWTSNL